jgi:hypothetical protein
MMRMRMMMAMKGMMKSLFCGSAWSARVQCCRFQSAGKGIQSIRTHIRIRYIMMWKLILYY